MTRRESALATIRAEVAREGKVNHIALRAYTENRLAYAAFQEAVAAGMRMHTAGRKANPRGNPMGKSKKESRASKAVKRVQEALEAGVVLHFSTARGDGTAGPHHTAVPSHDKYAIYRDYADHYARGGMSGRHRVDFYATAFSAADHLVAFIGVGNAIAALKRAGGYSNLDTPFRRR